MNYKLIAYIAHPITGRTGKELNEESRRTEVILKRYGIKVLDPILIEKLPSTDTCVPNRPDQDGSVLWKEDEAAIRESHVLINIAAELKSEGVLWELGYARFLLWKPIIRIYKPGSNPHMASIFKGDVIAFSLEEAAYIINRRWGTWSKRIMWRIKMLSRSLPKFIWRQIREFK